MRRSINADEALKKGLRYWLGDGVRRNEAKGRAFLLQAAEAGDPNALFFASEMLAHGEGGPFDRATAFRYVERSADLGNLEAIYSLGYYYMNGGMGNLGYSAEVLAQMRVQKDEGRGLALWKTAAARGHGLAAYRIGEYFEDLADDNANMLSCAIEWYEKSLDLGEPNGWIRLGDFHLLGKGVSKDRKTARSMYQRAADSDDFCAKEAGKQRLEDFEELETILQENC
jgi:TPR repeat protein